MGLIIDANKRDLFFASPLGPQEKVIVDWFLSSGRLVIGGRLRRELGGSEKMRRYLVSLKQAGKVRDIDDTEVDAKEQELSAGGLLSSDDPHVIALALVSRSRLLHTSDAALIDDFKRKEVIDRPRGRIFNGTVEMLRACIT